MLFCIFTFHILICRIGLPRRGSNRFIRFLLINCLLNKLLLHNLLSFKFFNFVVKCQCLHLLLNQFLLHTSCVLKLLLLLVFISVIKYTIILRWTFLIPLPSTVFIPVEKRINDILFVCLVVVVVFFV